MNSKSRVILLVGTPCASCDEAAQIWREAADAIGTAIEVRSIDISASGNDTDAGVTALPALLIDGEPLVVGVPQRNAAADLLRNALGED